MRQHMTMRCAQMVPPARWFSADLIAFVSGANASNGNALGNSTGVWPAIAQVALLPGTDGLSLTITDGSLQLGADSAQAGQVIEKVCPVVIQLSQHSCTNHKQFWRQE